METNFIFIAIAFLLNLAAFIWLLVVGFKRSVLWGILIFLFSPLSAIAFAVTHWFEAKKSFLAYIITSILFLIPLYSMIADYSADLAKISTAIDEGRIDPNEASRYIGHTDQLPGNESGEEAIAQEGQASDAVGPDTAMPDNMVNSEGEANPASDSEASDSEADAVVEESEPPPYPIMDQVKPDPLVAKHKPAEKDTTRVGVNKLRNFVGRYFIMTDKAGKQHRGILIKVTKSYAILERKIYGGTFTYKLAKSKIRKSEMLKKEYVESISER